MKIAIILGVLLAVIVLAAVHFVFNPLGLGPEPDVVLGDAFFRGPGKGAGELELLVDGEAAFREILRAVDAARSSIHVQTYIWKDDRIGRAVVSKLKAAADRGVKVNVRKDALGTAFELVDLLKGRPSPVFTKSGLKGYRNISVKVDAFAKTDHSKYFIVDRQEVIFGGMNIADEYHTRWHDYMVRIRDARWAAAFEDRVVKGRPWPETAPFAIVLNGTDATGIRTALLEMIRNARERLIIEHAYFSDDKIIRAVKQAAERGVRVNLLLPKKPDTHEHANMATINRLLQPESGSAPEIFLYPRMMHAKVILADGEIAAVGSANLTPRSMKTSREVTMFVHATPDDAFVRELSDRLDADMAESEAVTAPFDLDVFGKIRALAGKYVW